MHESKPEQQSEQSERVLAQEAASLFVRGVVVICIVGLILSLLQGVFA